MFHSLFYVEEGSAFKSVLFNSDLFWVFGTSNHHPRVFPSLPFENSGPEVNSQLNSSSINTSPTATSIQRAYQSTDASPSSHTCPICNQSKSRPWDLQPVIPETRPPMTAQQVTVHVLDDTVASVDMAIKLTGAFGHYCTGSTSSRSHYRSLATLETDTIRARSSGKTIRSFIRKKSAL